MTVFRRVENFSVASLSRTKKMTSIASLVDWLRFVVPATVVMASLFGMGVGVRYLGYEAEWRENEDRVRRAMLILDPTQTAVDDGYVIGWHVYTTRGRRSQKVYLQIWRPVKSAENSGLTWVVHVECTQFHMGQAIDRWQQYCIRHLFLHLLGKELILRRQCCASCEFMMVGETLIAALWVGYNYFALYQRDRIAIHRGDVLGIYFPTYNPIPWTGVNCHQGNQHLYKYNPYTATSSLATSGSLNAAGQRPNIEVTFITGKSEWNPCRQYSLNATIMTEQEMAQYDVDYQETTDGRYERRPYGRYLPSKRSSASSLLRPVNGWPSYFHNIFHRLRRAVQRTTSPADLQQTAVDVRPDRVELCATVNCRTTVACTVYSEWLSLTTVATLATFVRNKYFCVLF